MAKSFKQLEPFAVRDCALVVLATNVSAADLRELRDGLLLVEEASLYHHFWGRLLQPRFDEPEFNNDFASWVYRGLNDKVLAERLSAVDPANYESLSVLRDELVDLVEARLDERDPASWNQAQEPFHFTSSQMVVFDARQTAGTPGELAKLIPQLSLGSIFYHFIDARLRPPVQQDDFSAWLDRCGLELAELSAAIQAVDPYFSSLTRTQHVLREVFAACEAAHE